MIDVNKPIELDDGTPVKMSVNTRVRNAHHDGGRQYISVDIGKASHTTDGKGYGGHWDYYLDTGEWCTSGGTRGYRKIRNVAEAAPAHTFKVGDKVIRRDNQKTPLTIIHITEQKLFAVDDKDRVSTRQIDGRYSLSRPNHPWDYIPAPKEDVRYHTVAPLDGNGRTSPFGALRTRSLDDGVFRLRKQYGWSDKALKITYRDNQPFAVELVDLP